MDFSRNEFQAMLVDSVEKYISNEYDFETRQVYAGSESGFSADAWQNFCDLGWTALPFTEADGGLDGGPIETMLLMQYFGRGLVVEPYLANVVLAGGVLRRLADTAQKERWLQPMIAGKLQTALAFVEPQSRYELDNIITNAKADGDDWIISGQKSVVLNGGNAEMIIVAARTHGVSMFAVPADAPGVSRKTYATVDGATAAEITLDKVRVDADALLGEADTALPVLEAVIDEATLAVCAEAVGIMQVLSDKTVDYSKNRVQFGVPISSFQALQHRMVDMFTAAELSYSLLLWATMENAAGSIDAKRAVSAIKYQIGTAGKQLGQEAIQLHGGMGMSWEFDVGHYFKRLSIIGQIFGNADWHLDKLAS